MAHRIDQTKDAKGSAMYANAPAWHGLGTVLDHAPTAEEAIVAAGLDWAVEKRPLMIPTSAGATAIPLTFATVRTDTEAALGIVSDSYRILQNAEAFDALSVVLQEEGLTYESAGALDDGARVWLLARHPEKFFLGGDDTDRYLLLFNSHDASSCVRIIETPVRCVCRNTIDIALKRGRGSGVSIAHRATMDARIRDARSAFERTDGQFRAFATVADRLAVAKLSDATTDRVIDSALDFVLGPVPEADGKAVLAAAIDRTEKDPLARKLAKRAGERSKVDTILRRELRDAGAKLVNGWLLSQAIGEWIDTSRVFKGDDAIRAERRFTSLVEGDAATARTFVLERVMEAAGVSVN
jgi:phage/plasmid-like protein (TIGR03299 family)